MMRHRDVVDGGVALLQLAASEFFFTAEQAGILLATVPDAAARISVMVALLPRVVDRVNLTHCCYDYL
eukprot:SAG31_NODE_40740_length_279_cov_0.844444_1_plen_67_part_10